MLKNMFIYSKLTKNPGNIEIKFTNLKNFIIKNFIIKKLSHIQHSFSYPPKMEVGRSQRNNSFEKVSEVNKNIQKTIKSLNT